MSDIKNLPSREALRKIQPSEEKPQIILNATEPTFKIADLFPETEVKQLKFDSLVGKHIRIIAVSDISEANRPTVTLTLEEGETKTTSPHVIKKMRMIKINNWLPIEGQVIRKGKTYDII